MSDVKTLAELKRDWDNFLLALCAVQPQLAVDLNVKRREIETECMDAATAMHWAIVEVHLLEEPDPETGCPYGERLVEVPSDLQNALKALNDALTAHEELGCEVQRAERAVGWSSSP